MKKTTHWQKNENCIKTQNQKRSYISKIHVDYKKEQENPRQSIMRQKNKQIEKNKNKNKITLTSFYMCQAI